jgi:hypothetical protein
MSFSNICEERSVTFSGFERRDSSPVAEGSNLKASSAVEHVWKDLRRVARERSISTTSRDPYY